MNLDQFEGHTPGPLACVELMAFAAGFAVEDGEGRTVARIMKTHGVERLPSRANAALFAAAPDLLAEVRRQTAEADELRTSLAESMQQCRDTQDRLTAQQAECREMAARLAAIEKAEPVAWIERITGRLADPTDEHRTRFPMVYSPLIVRPAAAPAHAEIKQHPPIAWLMTAEGCDGSADWVEIGLERPEPVEGFTAVPLRRY